MPLNLSIGKPAFSECIIDSCCIIFFEPVTSYRATSTSLACWQRSLNVNTLRLHAIARYNGNTSDFLLFRGRSTLDRYSEILHEISTVPQNLKKKIKAEKYESISNVHLFSRRSHTEWWNLCCVEHRFVESACSNFN